MLMLDPRDARRFSPLEHQMISDLFDAIPSPDGYRDFKSFILQCVRAPQAAEILGLEFTVRVCRGATTKQPQLRDRYYVISPGTHEVCEPAWIAAIAVDEYTDTSTESPLDGYLIGDADAYLSAMTLVRTAIG